MNSLKNIGKSLTPTLSLEKQISWLPDRFERFQKSLNSSLTIAVIAGERVYWSMQYEGHILSLTESNWHWVLKYCDVDLLLIESCSQTATGDWFMAQVGYNLEDSLFGRMVRYAQQQNIPVAYWFTLDVQYFPLYQSIIEWFGMIYCADDRVIEVLEDMEIKAHYLPPAVQPALFNKLNKYSREMKELHRLVCDDLVDVIQSWEERGTFYQELQDFGALFFDSRSQVWNTKTKGLERQLETVRGSVDFFSRIELFRGAQTLGVLKSQSRTRTDMKWTLLEAAASHMTVLLEPEVEVGEFERMCLRPRTYDEFFLELIRHDKDRLYYERISQKAWREALSKHTYSHRVRTICQDFDLDHNWVEFPTAAVVTPSYRKSFFDRAKHNFTRQTYANKSWVMVFNGPMEEYDDVKREVETLNNSKALYVPEELHAGSCMNTGVKYASTQYAFRMDDDDYYGSNYILDMILFERVLDLDIIGTSFSFLSVNENGRNVLRNRKVSSTLFNKPSVVSVNDIPKEFNIIAGCSHGGRVEFILENPYSEHSYGVSDMQWLHKLKEFSNGTVVCARALNLVVERRESNDHTWKVDLEKIVEESDSIEGIPEDHCFV